MKIQVTKSILLKELATASKYRGREIKGGNTIGIPFISLSASEEGLKIRATDNQVYYENILPLHIVGEEDLEEVHVVIEAGQVALTQKFDEVLRKFPSEKVEIQVTGEKIILTADNVNAEVSTMDSPFDEAPTGVEGESINSPKTFFDNIITKTVFASSESDSRPLLKGINIKGDGTTFTAIATDSHRLAKYEDAQSIQIDNITIPAKPFASVLETFSDDGKVMLIPLGNYVKLQQEDKNVFIRLLDGNFPDTTKLVNVLDTVSHISINSKELINAIDRAIPFAKNDKGRPVVQLEMFDQGIKIFSSAEDGSMTSNVSINKSNGVVISEKIVLNAKFMIDSIKSHNSKEVTLVIESKGKPVYVLSEDKSNTQLILPIKY
ncbi:DNA polymerase III subunit beta [Lysinibacillus sp. UGB7]|uniref:DNA polymerase III subunit beta n=1 Tax=Lysinibacillus sp. UGB7 TaxID=3411039 RepID=UPI003B7BC842